MNQRVDTIGNDGYRKRRAISYEIYTRYSDRLAATSENLRGWQQWTETDENEKERARVSVTGEGSGKTRNDKLPTA